MKKHKLVPLLLLLLFSILAAAQGTPKIDNSKIYLSNQVTSEPDLYSKFIFSDPCCEVDLSSGASVYKSVDGLLFSALRFEF